MNSKKSNCQIRMLPRTIVLAASLLAVGICTAANAPRQPAFLIRRPTILAFFPPATPAELEHDPDTNEALSDFQLYANQARKQLSQVGVELKEVYALSFRVNNAGKTTRFHPRKTAIGYYLVAPGKRPRVLYGVQTDADLLQAASEYFGVGPR